MLIHLCSVSPSSTLLAMRRRIVWWALSPVGDHATVMVGVRIHDPLAPGHGSMDVLTKTVVVYEPGNIGPGRSSETVNVRTPVDGVSALDRIEIV